MLNITYDEVFSLENIFNGHKKCRQCKRKKESIVKFEFNQLANLYMLYDAMKSRSINYNHYTNFVVYEPKRREIQTVPYGMRVIQRVLCDKALLPYFSKRAIIDNCVCQEGKGMHFALKRFENYLNKFIKKHGQNGYVLKCDIKKYFPTMPHKKLIDLICGHIADSTLKSFVKSIIESYHTKSEYLKKYDIPMISSNNIKTERGIPIGNQTSQIFGMFYLDKLDRFIKEKLRIKIYSRYMDDFVIVHESKEYLQKIFAEVKSFIESLDLVLNEKSQIFPLKNGLTYLGFRYSVSSKNTIVKRVKKQTVKRFKSRIKLLNRAYFDGAIGNEDVRNTISAYHGHLVHSNSYKLEQKILSGLKMKVKK